MVTIPLACAAGHDLTQVPYFCRQPSGRTWRKMQPFPMAETNLPSLTAAVKREHYLSLFLAILFLPTRPQGLNHSSPKAKSGAWASSPATPCCHPANNRLGVPHPLPVPAPRSLPASGWLAGQRGAVPSQGWDTQPAGCPLCPRRAAMERISPVPSKPQRCEFSSRGGNAQRKTGFSSLNGHYLLLLRWQKATKPGPCLWRRDHHTTRMGRAGGGHGGHRRMSGEAYRGPALRPSRRLREGSAGNIFGSSSVAAGETCGTVRESSPRLRSPLPPGASQTELRGCPPLRGRGSRPGARRDPHGSGTAAAAEPGPPRELRGGCGGGGGTGRTGTGPARGDPAAGPAGLGGLGRPLPLQPSEMAEHVAIMPRHSGCPGPAGPNQRPADPPPLPLRSQKGEQNPARFCSPRA